MIDQPEIPAEVARRRSELAALMPASHASVGTFGAEALKAAALISGGSAAALMAFLGALLSKDQFELASWLPWSLQMFVGALISACFASGASYLAQYMCGRAVIEAKESLDTPPYEDSRLISIYQRAGFWLQLLAIALVVATYVMTIEGYRAVYRAIEIVGFRPIH